MRHPVTAMRGNQLVTLSSIIVRGSAVSAVARASVSISVIRVMSMVLWGRLLTTHSQDPAGSAVVNHGVYASTR
jgi:hypothetical protein